MNTINKKIIAVLLGLAAFFGYGGAQLAGSSPALPHRANAPATTGPMLLVGGVGVQLVATNSQRHLLKIVNLGASYVHIECNSDKPAVASTSPYVVAPLTVGVSGGGNVLELGPEVVCTGGVRATSTASSLLTVTEF